MGLFNFILSSLFICNKDGIFFHSKIWKQASISASLAPTISNNIHGSFFLALNTPINVISISGEDRIRLLHSLGTNSFECSVPGKIIYNCNLNGKGKLICYTRCMITETDIKILCNSYSASDLLKLLDKSIFPMDRVKVVDETALWHVYTTIGTDDNNFLNLSQFEVDDKNPVQDSVQKHVDQFKEYSITTNTTTTTTTTTHNTTTPTTTTTKVYILPGNDLMMIKNNNNIRTQISSDELFTGHTLLASKPLDSSQFLAQITVPSAAAADTTILTTTASEELWEALSVLVGRPGLHELTDKYSPLEAGLMHTLHFSKGCFVGQEIISKAVSSKSVSRNRLVGIKAMRNIKKDFNILKDDTDTDDDCNSNNAVFPQSGYILLDNDGTECGTVTTYLTPTSRAATAAKKYILPWLASRGGHHPTHHPLLLLEGLLKDGLGIAYVRGDSNSGGTVLRAVLKEKVDSRSILSSEQPFIDEMKIVPVQVEVEVVDPLPFPRYDISFSPSPPALKMKTSNPAAATTTADTSNLLVPSLGGQDRDSPPLSLSPPPVLLSAEELRKKEKLETMAKKVAALQKKKNNLAG